MKLLYLVRCRFDGLSEEQWGVDVSYNLVLATTNQEKAYEALKQANSEAALHRYGERTSFDIVEVELEKSYPIWGDSCPFLGGASYLD